MIFVEIINFIFFIVSLGLIIAGRQSFRSLERYVYLANEYKDNLSIDLIRDDPDLLLGSRIFRFLGVMSIWVVVNCFVHLPFIPIFSINVVLIVVALVKIPDTSKATLMSYIHLLYFFSTIVLMGYYSINYLFL
jgi:hypothetical protein